MSWKPTLVAKRTAVLAVLLLLTACASVQRRPVPVADMDRAIIPGMPEIRDWGDQPSPRFQQDLIRSVRDTWAASSPEELSSQMSALVLSGGGSNGAFGAGFLRGWAATGTRPEFHLVTGISTGALIAPFAFLGSDYDGLLERVFTTVTNRDIYRIRNPLTVARKDSLARTDPLASKLEEVFDEGILQAIAAEHRRGRRLFVGTTNLDAQRFVIWNMGAIAASDQPDALELFRKVLLASASIPVAFPPVYFEVEVDGSIYDEMHVDGGVISELFLWGAMVDITDARQDLLQERGVSVEASIYIIRNSQIDAEPIQVRPNLVGIASRSMITLLKSVAMGDLARIWAHAAEEGVDFNFVGIPPEHPEAEAATFDPADMRRLFELGRAMALQPEPWRKEPPSWIR
jgi:hypothetical protein